MFCGKHKIMGAQNFQVIVILDLFEDFSSRYDFISCTDYNFIIFFSISLVLCEK